MNENKNTNSTINSDSTRCSLCRFFRPTEDTCGECHCNPPEPTYGNSRFLTRWQTVKNDDWCGQFEPKAGNAGEKNNA